MVPEPTRASADGRRPSTVWWVALLGALAAGPATFVLTRLPATTASPGGGVVVVGSAIAGALAVRWGVDASAAGLRTGFIGGVVGTVAFLLGLDPAGPWAASRLLFVLVAPVVVVGGAALFGVAFGRLGGWVARRLGGQG